MRKAYQTDLSDAEWSYIEPHIPTPKGPGRHRVHSLREILDAIFYIVVRSGCAWRLLPHDFPPWKTVHHYFRTWRIEGSWERIHTALRRRVRVRKKRDPQPSAGVVDSQSVKSTGVGGDQRGYDGGKKVKGRKRHLLVDTEGLVLQAKVHSAKVMDYEGIKILLKGADEMFPRLSHLWLDGGYRGEDKGKDWVEKTLGWSVDQVERPRKPAPKEVLMAWAREWAKEGVALDWQKLLPPQGFVVLPRRWVVERTFSWIDQYRRMSKDYEPKKFALGRRRWHYASQQKVLSRRVSVVPTRRLPIMRILTGLLIVAVAMLIAIGGLVLVQRLYSADQRKQHNDVTGFIYAVLGVAYAVLLGLMLIAVWERWNAAEDITTDEANELAGIFWFAHALPQPEGRHIQELVRSYAQVVVEDEWPLMAQGRSSPEAWAILDELRATILGLNPPTGAQQTGYDQMRYNQMLDQLHNLADARRERLLYIEEGVPTIMWVVLILGGVITVGFTYLFGMANTLVHLLMVAALALIISLSLFTVAALDYPFKGDIRIHSTAYEQDLERFRESKFRDL